MTTIQLTSTQQQVLEHAADTIDGRIDWFPESVKGGARKKVIDGLLSRGLITNNGGSHWYITAEGFEALGRSRPDANPSVPPAPEDSLPVTVAAKPRVRETSKQATVIKMLQRPEGASIHHICEATGWQAHTVRGLFAGTLKKKLGLVIQSDKSQGDARQYRIV
jgi:hypothetical protein